MQPSDRKNTAHFPERTAPDGGVVANKILLSIPEDEFLAIGPHLEPIALPRHCILHEPSEKLNFVYFPNAGLLSLVVAMEDGKTVEAAVVQRKKHIEYTRGAVKILSRKKLEGSACECYGVIQQFNTEIGLKDQG